jgi:hypothetical protein
MEVREETKARCDVLRERQRERMGGRTAGEAVRQLRCAQRARALEQRRRRDESSVPTNATRVQFEVIEAKIKRALDLCNDQVANLLDALMEMLQRSEREAAYGRRVAAGRIRFIDFKGLLVPVDIGPDGARAERVKKRGARRGDGSEPAPVWKCRG